MAKQIKSSEIYEDDIFKNIRESAEKTIETINKINAEFKQTGEVLKKSIGGAKFDSAKSVNEFVKAQSQANKLQKEAIQLDKARIEAERQMAMATAASEKAEQQAIKTEREKLKLDQDLARQAERKAKAEEKAAKAARDESSAYKQLEKNTRELKNQSKELAAQMLVMERNGQKNSKAYRELASKYKEVTRAAQQGDAQLKRIDSTIGDNFRNVGNYKSAVGGLKNALGQLGLAFGIGSVVRGAGETIVQFDKQVADLKAITGASGDDLTFFKEQAAELGKSVEGGASQVIEAYKLIGSAKPELLSNAQALDSVTQAAITLSQASGLELTDAATRLTDAMNQFGAPAEEAGKFINVLANGALFGSAAIPDVTDALLKFGAAANTSNVGLEESTALIELLASKGLKGAEAGTALRNVMLKLSAPDALPKEAQDRLADLGISMEALKDTSKPFADRLDALKPLLNDNAALVKVFGTENAIAATNLLRGTDAVRQLTKDMETQGTAQKQAKENTNTLSFAFNELKESWNAMILQLSSGDGMNLVVDGIKFLAANLGTIVGLLGKVAIAFGVYKTALLAIQAKQFLFNGGLQSTITGMKNVFTASKTAADGAKSMASGVSAAGKTMSAVPWVAIIGAVIELAMAFYDVASGAAEARRQQQLTDAYTEKAAEQANLRVTERTKLIDKEIAALDRKKQTDLAAAKSEKQKAEIESKYLKDREKIVSKQNQLVNNDIKSVEKRIEKYEELKEIFEKVQAGAITKEVGRKKVLDLYNIKDIKELKNVTNGLLTSTDLLQMKLGGDATLKLTAGIESAKEKIKIYREELESVDERLKDYTADVDANTISQTNNSGKINAKIPKMEEYNETLKHQVELIQEVKEESKDLFDVDATEQVLRLEKERAVVLAQIAETNAQIALEKAKAGGNETDIQKAEADLQNAQANLINAQLQLDLFDEFDPAKRELLMKQAELDLLNLKTKTIETEKEIAETRMEYFKLTTEYFKKQSDERIKQYEKEISKAEEQYNTLQELAKNGNINAKESLAEQQRIINEANAKKEKEQRRQARLQLLETAFSTYNQKVASGAKNPLAETIRDIGLLRAFIDTLPAYFDGTEDTGKNGNGVDGKGGFHAILHPNERVIPKSLNDKIGDLSNEQLTKLAMEYQNGKTIRGNEQIASAFDTMLLVQKIDELNSTIKNKPETNIELGEITQSAMNIVKSVKKGNTTIYNRYRIKP